MATFYVLQKSASLSDHPKVSQIQTPKCERRYRCLFYQTILSFHAAMTKTKYDYVIFNAFVIIKICRFRNATSANMHVNEFISLRTARLIFSQQEITLQNAHVHTSDDLK